jgi:inner membrane protein involved in colicin E2 resistance
LHDFCTIFAVLLRTAVISVARAPTTVAGMTSPLRIVAIICIFIGATVSWQVLGAITSSRTRGQNTKLSDDVRSLWGQPQVQNGPVLRFAWETTRTEEQIEEENGKKTKVDKVVIDRHEREVSPDQSDIDVAVSLDQRLRGLMWYSLYGVTFDGRWQYRHQAAETGVLYIDFRFAQADAIYDDFRFIVNGRDISATLKPQDGKAIAELPVAPGAALDLRIHYRTRGLDTWAYQPQSSGVANLRNFTLKMTCDFRDIDYPRTALSPSTRQTTGNGWQLVWRFSQVLTGQSMGLVMPSRIQPGELASALAHSAPVSLLFFFLVVFSLSVLRRFDIHPINYLGIAGAFFAFHLLFSYSVDHLALGWAFFWASAVSLLLVASYLRLVVSPQFAYREAAICQLIYQVGFSVAHFFPGYTGLAISVMATLTLFILMQLTGRVRWSQVFARVSGAGSEKLHAVDRGTT